MQLRLRTMRGGAWRVAVGRYVVPVRVRVCVFVFVESLWSLCGVFVGTWTACLFASSAWRMEDLEDLEESCGADARSRSRSRSTVAGVCCQVSAGRGGRQGGRCGWLYGWSPEVCVGRWMGGGARAGRRLVAGGWRQAGVYQRQAAAGQGRAGRA